MKNKKISKEIWDGKVIEKSRDKGFIDYSIIRLIDFVFHDKFEKFLFLWVEKVLKKFD